jgi:hypothetical protein
MKTQKALYYGILASAVISEAIALGVKSTDKNNKGVHKIPEVIKENGIPFGITTTAIPLAIDAIMGGKPLTAFGMSVLASTSIRKLFIEYSKKNDTPNKDTSDTNQNLFQKIDTNANYINAAASTLCLGQNFVNGNPNVLHYFPSAQFAFTSILNQGFFKKIIGEEKLPKISTANFMLASLILGSNLLKAGKTPQALLAFNLAFMASVKLHDLSKPIKNKENQ